MKGKLYVFGIGGTGSRVLKSLVMLSASGVRFDADAIVPIVVDPDFANADLTRTIELIKTYSAIRKELSFNDGTSNTFFSTRFEQVVNDNRLALKDTKNKKFRDFIEYSSLSKENKAFASMLFSESNLEADMEVGFKGNPNIGSVVLNQFTDSQDFLDFAAAFKTGDRIFIISSIFGGTGASGFPLLLKNLRSLDDKMPNFKSIQDAPIGAITVLPYFKVKPDEASAIDSSTFIGKTKAALRYYEKNVSGAKSSLNALYYVADDRDNQYENNEGGVEQQNNAHIVEFISALAIEDFVAIPDDDSTLICDTDENGRVYAPNAKFKEFGIEQDVQEVLFNNLAQSTKDIVCAPMTQFVLFAKYVKDHLKGAMIQPWAKDNNITDAFLRASFANNVRKFTDSYLTWLNEMADNDRSFKPYKLSVSGSDLYSMVDGIKPDSIKALWAFNKSGYDLFDAALNDRQTSLSKNYSNEQKFVELFCIVSKLLVDKKYKF